MTHQTIIDRTVNIINQLPEDKAVEISDFADFIIKKYEEQLLTNNIQKITSLSNTFSFLEEEEDLYSVTDLKQRYND